MQFDRYDTDDFYDEMFVRPGVPRPGSILLAQILSSLSDGELASRQKAAEAGLFNMGITFNVYGHEAGVEKVWPFDIIPRIVEANEWAGIEDGLRRRIQALNLFIDDIYHDRKILKDGVIPEFVISSASGFLLPCVGLAPPLGVWCHIAGIDLVRDRDGRFYVLEDNLRCPSGVSYVLENREILKRTFPQVFEASHVRPVDDYPSRLLEMLRSLAAGRVDNPCVVLLTPGPYNSAYYEHSFLTREMGIELVEGRDLVVRDGFVCMRTTRGFERVDVIYRRIDDVFLDIETFRSDSMLGIPGLMRVYREGRVAIANAPGTGVADDKVVYGYVPDIVRYYLGEEIRIPNVPTYLCWRDDDRQYVLDHLDALVVKAANASGGYGMMIGPHATTQERDEFSRKIQDHPREYIAQPVVGLSRAPVIVENHCEGRHEDLRPFVLSGKDIYVLPGGLTRVALRKGSLVVNSSQGGGSKDTWVLDRPEN